MDSSYYAGFFGVIAVILYIVVIAVGLWVQYLIIRTAVLHALRRHAAEQLNLSAAAARFSGSPAPSRPQPKPRAVVVPKLANGSTAPAGWYKIAGRGRGYWNGSDWTTPLS